MHPLACIAVDSFTRRGHRAHVTARPTVVAKRGDPVQIAVEVTKAQAARLVALRRGDFTVPEVAGHDPARGSVEFERLHGFFPVRSFISYGNNSAELVERIGSILAGLHRELVLPPHLQAPVAQEWVTPKCGWCVVHGDFNTDNVLYNPRTDRLAIIDWSVSRLLGGRGSIGPTVLDVAWFARSLFLVPAHYLFMRSAAAAAAGEFIAAYERHSDQSLDRDTFADFLTRAGAAAVADRNAHSAGRALHRRRAKLLVRFADELRESSTPRIGAVTSDEARRPATRAAFTVGLYHGPLFRGSRGYETYGPYARYVAEFARRFERVIVFAPVTTGATDYRGCTIDAPNVEVVELPHFENFLQAMRHAPTILRTLAKHAGRMDVMNCRHTAPFGSLLYFLCRCRQRAFFYHFTSDPWEVLTTGAKYRGLCGVLARTAYAMAFRVQRFVMRRVFCFVNGQAPATRLRRFAPRIEAITSSALTDSDFHLRESFALHTPVRLLYVGYLKHMKGLEFLVEAVRILRGEGIDVGLKLVGSGPLEGELTRRVRDEGVEKAVSFDGYVPMGPALSERFREADIFVFPSLSEGSPRAVLEALAHSLPTISTSVGGVPELIRDGESGLLVDQGNPRAIAEAVKRYLGDDALRMRCARGGHAAARGHTVERFVGRLAKKAEEIAVSARDVRVNHGAGIRAQ